MTTTAPVPSPIPLPVTLNSPAWWVAALNQTIALAVGFIVLLHPGFVIPPWVQGAVPIVAQAAATAVWVWALHAHKQLTLAAMSHNTQMQYQQNENAARISEARLSHQFQQESAALNSPASVAAQSLSLPSSGLVLHAESGSTINIQQPAA